MIRNYFLIALRNLWRNRIITLINLAGMAIGFAIFLSFWSWTRFDLSFDKFHEDIDQMYILNIRIFMNGSEYTSQRTGGIFASVLPENFPQVLSSCRVSTPLEFELGVVNEEDGEDVPMRYFSENEVIAVDSSFLKFFSFRLVKGNMDQIFTERDHLVVTEGLATRLFGKEDPLGQSVKMGEGGFFKVVGVVEDPPEESSFQFSALLGFHIMEQLGYPVNGAGGNIYYSNFKLAPEADLDELNVAVNEYVEANFEPDLEPYFFLDRLTRLHLHGETRGIIGLYMNLIMSLLILSIAVINFINLTTAYASDRVKEIAIRKCAGAGKKQLIIQFMGETYLLLLLAFYLGLFMAEHMVPWMSRAFNVGIQSNFNGFSFWIQVVLIFTVTGLLAGLYPAAKIAGFDALGFLSGKRKERLNVQSRSRKVLIVVQFSFSIIFIIISIFMIRQYNFLQEADLGFNREDVMYVRTTGMVWEEYPQIKSDLASFHFVEGVTTGSRIPVYMDLGEIDWGERDGEHNRIAMILRTDEDFLSTFEINLLEGSYFTQGHDSLNRDYVVVNQSLVDVMEWKDPVGRSFYLQGRDYQILGVTGNIDFFPFNLEVFEDRALIYRYESVEQYVFIRMNQGASAEQIARIGDVFLKYNPGYEFSYEFVSDYKYITLESADGIRLMFILFSGFAIFIATMGLIGLSLFYSNRRVKEVGIRKAMGAHSGMIMQQFLYDFLKLVALSNLIAIPAAFMIMRWSLQFFTYSVDLKVSVFITVALLSLMLSVITISFHALRTALSNPVDSLRYE